MSPKFEIGDDVLVPARRLPSQSDANYALVQRTVRDQIERRIVIDDAMGGVDTVELASRLAQPADLELKIVRIGDLQTELGLLNPLARSIFQYSKLLLPDDRLQFVEVRSVDELRQYWNRNPSGSHVVLVGHGTTDGSLSFLGGDVSADDLASVFDTENLREGGMTFLSLACHSGLAAFAQGFSRSTACRSFTAPIHELHGAEASYFCQGFFTSLFLEGVTPITAFRKSSKSLVGATRFRFWKDGSLVSGRS